ncbi:MAG TPA: protein kinase, partial [Kofleriaceae bacterium]|nr:protein kinase [Kofleriaceae bacterium]
MARIYIARSTGIGSFERHVVLKMILPERAQDETSVQMFLNEARLAASLNHQNVAQVFEVGKEAGIHFLAMEYVHGQDLRALLAKAGSSATRVPLELALTVIAGAAAGLDHAHERRNSDGSPMGIVHRDVSPSNIMIGYDGAVKLLDFGIAKATARSIETQSGVIKGKFAYMAPEQCRGREVDRRSDVFSLGIVLYEVTTQHRCFRADSDFDTMHRIVSGDIVRPSRLVPGYPAGLEAIVMKALAVDPAQRYQTAGLLLEAIESFAVAARMPLSTMSLGRFMREMFGDVPEPWLGTGRTTAPAQAAQAKEQTISNTSASSDPPAIRAPSSPPSLPSSPPTVPPSLAPPGAASPVPAVSLSSASGTHRPLAATHSSQAIARPSVISPGASPSISPSISHSASSTSHPAPSTSPSSIQRPASPSTAPLSSPSIQRPSSPSTPPLVLPPEHEQAPLHLPPDTPIELAGDAGQLVPEPRASRSYPRTVSPAVAIGPALAAPAPAMRLPELGNPAGGFGELGGHTDHEPRAAAPNPPASTALGSTGMAPITVAVLPFSEPSRSESGLVHDALAPGASLRQSYAHVPAISRSELHPRFDAQLVTGDISLQPSARRLYIALGAVLVGIIILLVISILSDPDDLPAPPPRDP